MEARQAETPSQAKELFISYAHKDREFVLRLTADLEARGVLVWIDQGDIFGGAQWRQAIASGVEGCQALLLVVSPDSIGSQYVAEELAQGFKLGLPVIPLIYRKTSIPKTLDAQLSRYQYLDFRHGGYAQNLEDLLNALTSAGIALTQLSEAERAERRSQRLGAAVQTQWGAVITRIPQWALAWAFGWALFWLIVPFALLVVGGDVKAWTFALAPALGFAAGLGGGLVAGGFTMVALRHHAASIQWRHISPAIRTWGLVGPIGVIAGAALVYVLFGGSGDVDCTNLSIGACTGASIVTTLVVYLVLIIIAFMFAVVFIFGLGAMSGLLTVRHIRKLEPGIEAISTAWVVLGWGGGAIVAAAMALVGLGLLDS